MATSTSDDAPDVPTRPDARRPDTDGWARHSGPLSVGHAPAGALNLNVEGRELAGPLQGFGKLWQKTYRVRLTGVAATPQDVIAAWKANYGAFWPDGNNFYAPLAGIQPGEVGLINADMPGGMKLSTGVMVLYADDVSFTYMTPLGHPFAGWITFSAEHDDAGVTYAQVEVLMRATDPASELGLTLGGHRTEDRMWQATLSNLAAHFSVADPDVDAQVVCIDRKRQWRRAGNIRHDAALRTATHLLTAPIRAIGMSWRGLLSTAALTNALVQVLFLAVVGEVIAPVVVFAILPLVGLGLLSRWERVGAGVIATAALLQLVGSIPFIAAAVAHPESPVDFLHATFSVVAAASSIIAGAALLRRRTGSPRRCTLAGAVVLTALLVGSLAAATITGSDRLDAGEVELAAERAAWQSDPVTAIAGGTVHVDNRDPYRHTFTVDVLGIEVELPGGTARDVRLAGVAPGTYQLTCAVPGHESMTTTLVVEP